jgi:hypothetical protein
MKYPQAPLVSQHLGVGQSLYLYMFAGHSLLSQQGQASIEQSVWIAERMLIRRTDLHSEQNYVCQASGWVKLIGLSELDFVVVEHSPAARSGWRSILSSLSPHATRWFASSTP